MLISVRVKNGDILAKSYDRESREMRSCGNTVCGFDDNFDFDIGHVSCVHL